jgi:alkylresorcinol/alkylpyrone synthase
MHIVSVGTAKPPHHYDQDALIAAFERHWAKQHFNLSRVRRFHEAVLVGGRHLALPVEDYEKLQHFGDANDAFIRVGLDVGEVAITDALQAADLSPTDIDALFCASVTGIATPSLDARLFHRMGLRPDLKRTPIFGLGCVAGAAGLSRVYDYLKAWPDQVAVLLCVELCSLTLQRGDLSVANLIASGLFGDGAAAVVCVGAERARKMGLETSTPSVVATRSRLYPDSERVMGWDIGPDGFKVVLDKSVPKVVESYLRDDVDGLLADHGLSRADIGGWICHPGGPKVLSAYAKALEVPDEAFALTWESLRREGNMSSASVLFVLRDTIASGAIEDGANALVLAMGPGFCSEGLLLRWRT